MKPAIIIFLILIVTGTQAQIQQPVFDQITRIDGLPEDQIMNMMQDSSGYIWIATQIAIVRYDGHTMEQYKFAVKDGLGGGYNMYQDKSGTIWIDGAYKMHKYNPVTNTFEAIKSSVPDSLYLYHEMSSIAEDRDGNIWTTTKLLSTRIIIQKIAAGNDQSVIYSDTVSLGIDLYSTLFGDSEGNLWLATQKGLFLYDKISEQFNSVYGHDLQLQKLTLFYNPNIYEFKSYPGKLWFVQQENEEVSLVQFDIQTGTTKVYPYPAEGDSNKSITNNYMAEDHTGNIWLGTSRGVFCFNPQTESFKAFPYPDVKWLTDKKCLQLIVGKDNDLWVMTGSGFFYIPPQQDKMIEFGNDEQQKRIQSGGNAMFLDKNNGLWITTFGKSLFHLNKNKSEFRQIIRYSNNSNFTAQGITSLCVSKTSNKLYFSNKVELYISDENFTNMTKIDFPFKDCRIESLVSDKMGRIWIGTNACGLIRYNPETNQFKVIPVDTEELKTKVNNRFRFLLIDSKNRLWVGTDGAGACFLDLETEKWTSFPFTPMGQFANRKKGVLDDGQVRSMYEDQQGTIWIGTNLGGINRFDENTGQFISSILAHKGFSSVTALFQDSKGRHWAGSYLTGLTMFDPDFQTFKIFDPGNGLISHFVLSIKSGATGKLWAFADVGISVLDPDDFSIRNYSYKNGLPREEMDRLTQQGELPNGNWLITTNNNLIAFNPNHLTINNDPPRTILQSLVFNTQGENVNRDSTIWLHGQQEIKLRYFENRVSFHYTGIHFVNPELIEYKYMLKGLDKNWINAGTQPYISYTNLSPGKYIFKVLAANSDGVWSEKPAEINLTILPPWWKTTFAYVSYFVILLAGIIIFDRLQKKRVLEKEREAQREKELVQAKEIEKAYKNLEVAHENLKSTQAQLIQAEKMASLGELTAGIAHEIQNPLNFVNNFSEVSTELLDEMKDEIDAENYEEVKAITEDVIQNLEKILHHGKRADGIVKSMLQHSRGGGGEKILTDINVLADEYLRLSYHGLRAKDKSFNADFKLETDDTLPKINIIPQDIGRVLLNLINNAFYTVSEKARQNIAEYKPVVTVSTKWNIQKSRIEIRVKDNGNGIPEQVKKKIFQPFFTTKPTGQGTGLGLSLSYDIIKTHKGEIKVESIDGEGTEFTVELPKN